MNNLPDIDNYYNLEGKKIDFFWQNGFVVLKNVLSKSEIAAYRDEIKKVAEERNKDKNYANYLSSCVLSKIFIKRICNRY